MTETLCADLGSSYTALAAPGLRAVLHCEMPGRRRFPYRPDSVLLINVGDATVLSCPPDMLEWAQGALSELSSPGDAFGLAFLSKLHEVLAVRRRLLLRGPMLHYCCASDTLCSAAVPPNARIFGYEGEELESLFLLPGWPNALNRTRNGPRPDVLGVAAKVEDEIVAVAGASADSDRMWQVGVDVLPGWRGKGLGTAVVAQLTAAILERDVLPYYSTSLTNLASRSVAGAVGYWPTWVDVFTV